MAIDKKLTKDELDLYNRQLAKVERYSKEYYQIMDYWTNLVESRGNSNAR